MTFHTFCQNHGVTETERVELAHYLALFRYRRTLESVLPREEVGE